jgi:hypothetical protein
VDISQVRGRILVRERMKISLVEDGEQSDGGVRLIMSREEICQADGQRQSGRRWRYVG